VPKPPPGATTPPAATDGEWSEGITAAILLGVSNAKNEGLNRVAELQARKAYGFRNPRTHQGQDHLDSALSLALGLALGLVMASEVGGRSRTPAS
jgi:hypothetical protein